MKISRAPKAAAPTLTDSADDAVKPWLSLPIRRAVASVGIVVFLCLYVMGVSDIGHYLPRDNTAVQLLFYALAGILWGVPILPLISWSEAYKKKLR